MARYALRLLGIEDPKNCHDLVVYVECDRCFSDAIGTVTGCKLGKRNLKWMDYGKSAATFLNLNTGEAVRISRGNSGYPPDGADLVGFFEAISDEELFKAAHVNVNYKPEDLPGKPLHDSIICPGCGEDVMDGRHVFRDGAAICRACAEGAYYSVAEPI